MSKKKHPFTSNITVNKNIKPSSPDDPLSPKAQEMAELIKKYPPPLRSKNKIR